MVQSFRQVSPGIQVSRHTVLVDRGCWRPRTVHSGVTSDIKGRMEKVHFTLLWCCCSLPLMGVQVSQPVMLCIRDKPRWRRSQQRRSGCMVLLDSFLSLLGLCQVLSLLRARAWQVVVSVTCTFSHTYATPSQNKIFIYTFKQKKSTSLHHLAHTILTNPIHEITEVR